MSYFRYSFNYKYRFYNVLACVSDFEKKIFFNTEDLASFLKCEPSDFFNARECEEILISRRWPTSVYFVEYDDMLDNLERISHERQKDPKKSNFLLRMFLNGHVREVNGEWKGEHRITRCGVYEGMRFIHWKDDFIKDYGPQ